jgi:hypothetical protein
MGRLSSVLALNATAIIVRCFFPTQMKRFSIKLDYSNEENPPGQPYRMY